MLNVIHHYTVFNTKKKTPACAGVFAELVILWSKYQIIDMFPGTPLPYGTDILFAQYHIPSDHSASEGKNKQNRNQKPSCDAPPTLLFFLDFLLLRLAVLLLCFCHPIHLYALILLARPAMESLDVSARAAS